MSFRSLISRPAARIALLYMVLAGLWILASDFLLSLFVQATPGVASAQTVKGLGFVLATTLLLYFLLRQLHFGGKQHEQRERRGQIIETHPMSRQPVLVFGLFALGLVAIGVILFHLQQEQIRANTQAQLKAIGELRVEQIQNWLNSARLNAQHFGRNSQLVREFESWLESGGKDQALAAAMVRRMRQIKASYGYTNFSLFDLQGTPLLTEKPDPLVAEHHDDVLRAIASGRPLLIDFHTHGDSAEPMLGMVAPLVASGSDGRKVVGAMFFSLPARQTLFSIIQRWPTPSASGETVLVHHAAKRLRVLYASRQPALRILKLDMSAVSPNLVSTRVSRGESGVLDNVVDYRQVPVLAYAASIPDTPWILVAKLDQREVDAPVDALAQAVTLIVALLLLAAGLAAWWWWRAQYDRQRALLFSKELERRVLERHYDFLSRYSNDAILLLDMAEGVIDSNARVREMYGYEAEELIGESANLLRPAELRDSFDTMRQQLLKTGQLIYETVHQHKDGRQFPVEASARLIDQEGLQRIHVSVRDISERKAVEAQLRLQSLVLDQIQDTVTITDLNGIISYVNETLCLDSGYTREQLIGQPISIFGNDSEADLSQEEIRLATLENRSWQGRLSNLRADGAKVEIELRTTLIRDADGQPICMVGIGSDISERLRIEAELRQREARYRAVIETSADGFWMIDLEGRLLEVNDAYCRLSGYRREELLGKHISDLDAQEDPEETARHMAQIIATGSGLFESQHRTKDGTVWQVEVNTAFSRETGRVFAFLRDINRRNRSDALLRTRLQLTDLALADNLDDLLQAALNAAELFTRSQIGFFHYVDADQQNITLQAWSSNSVDHMCSVEAQQEAKGRHYPLDQAGVWADCIRTRQPEIHNDYASLADKNGLPAGLAPLQRQLVIPLLHDDKVSAVFGVGNKFGDYTPDDLAVVEQIASMVMDVVARKHTEEALRESESYNKMLFSDSRIPMVVMDPETLRIIDCNQAALDVYGLPDRLALLNLTPIELSPVTQYDNVDSLVLARRNVARVLHEGALVFEWRHRRSNGDIWDAQVNLMRFQHGARTLLQFTLEDITQKKRADERLKQAAMVFESIADGIIITDAQRNIQAVNRAFTDVTGYSSTECLGRNPSLLKSGHQDDDYYRVMWETLNNVGYWHGEIWNRRRNGEEFPEWLAITAVKDDVGAVSGYIGVFTDLSEQHALKRQLEQATYFDPLTGLPNARRMLQEVELLLMACRGNGEKFALLVLNVDRFAQLNESLGRQAGDRVLARLAQRWAAILPDSSMLARLDADQFAVLWRDDLSLEAGKAEAMTHFMTTANALLESMSALIEVGESVAPVALTISLGIAIYPGDANDAPGLLHAAEDAMRSAKAERGNQIRFFDRQYAQTAIDWFDTEAALRLALERDELFLVYQPQVDANNGRVVAAESLIRWHHDGQVVPPARFIHVVEGTDLAEPISRWVLNTACRQARQWLNRRHPLRVAVNIFSDHVTSGHLLDDVRDALAKSGLPASLLEIEVVESSLLKNPETAAHTLREIKRLGVSLALDDFGTGYSSLGYLKHYPFDVLKIDQIFARNVTRDPEDAAIVRSTIGLAHNLGMRVLAEGIETEPQLRFMLRYGCDQIQGYLTSRPTSPEAVETMVMDRRDMRPAGQARSSPVLYALIIEDEPIEAEMMALLLQDAGYGAHVVADLEGALQVMGGQRIDLVISDYYLETTNGVDALAHLRRLFPEVPRIMVSGTDDSAAVRDSVNRGGVMAFLPKPVDSDYLLSIIHGLLDNYDLGKNLTR